MKIAVVGPAHIGHVRKWALFLSCRGHDVRVFTDSELPKEIDYGSVPVEVCPWSRLQSFVSFKLRPSPWAANRDRWRVFRKPLAQFSPDVLHVHEALRTGAILQHFPQYPSVLTPWGTDVEGLARSEGLKRALVLRAFAFATIVSTNAPGLEERWAAMTGVKKEKFRFFSWGVDIDTFRPRPEEEQDEARRAVGISAKSPFLLSPRRADGVRGIDRVLGAWRLVCERPSLEGAELLILRGGADDAEWAWLQNEAGEQKGIVLCDEFHSPDRMAALCSAARGVVMAPPKDLLANSLLEAMACGAPLIVPDNPCYREALCKAWTEDEQRAPAFIARDAGTEALADSLTKWAECDDETLREIGVRSCKVAKERFSAKDCMPRMEQALEAAIVRWKELNGRG